MKPLEELEQALDYRFGRRQLLEQALTHSSHAHEQNLPFEDNERMEFLGDSILSFVISDLLCQLHPQLSEGQLSKLRGFLVSAANLVQYADRIRLGDYLRLGRGEEKTGGRTKQALLVDAFEALIAAVYIDRGLDAARQVVSRFFQKQIEEISVTTDRMADFKSALQEILQSDGQPQALYELVEETGPDHEKLFTVEVFIGGKPVASGMGLTKKAAEQAAAMRALDRLKRASSAPHEVT